jgi:outer membrane protein OmpA-like peptidoglycan-associated protein
MCISQNLIYNGDFENSKIPYVNLSIYSDIHFSKGWSNPNFASPDFYHIEKNPNKELIYEIGKSKPHTGKSYAGIGFYGNTDFEYIQTKLVKKLIKNTKYCLTVFFQLGENIDYSVSEIGFALTNDKINAKHKKLIGSTLSYILCSAELLKKTNKWIEVKSIYTANGNEKYLTIGNFNPYLVYNVISKKNNKKKEKYTYYYIDDVSLLEIKDSSECACNEVKPIKKDSVKVEIVKSYYDSGDVKAIMLNNLVFESNKIKLLPVSNAELDKLVNYLKTNPTKTIELFGYTDNTGKELDNIKLSEARVKSVADYLISKGIETKRITFKGYGSKNPIKPNDTELNKAKNRRVEFKIK